MAKKNSGKISLPSDLRGRRSRATTKRDEPDVLDFFHVVESFCCFQTEQTSSDDCSGLDVRETSVLDNGLEIS